MENVVGQPLGEHDMLEYLAFCPSSLLDNSDKSQVIILLYTPNEEMLMSL